MSRLYIWPVTEPTALATSYCAKTERGTAYARAETLAAQRQETIEVYELVASFEPTVTVTNTLALAANQEEWRNESLVL